MYTMKESNPLICPLLLQLVIDHLVFIQGERFGGALDGSAQQFSQAYDSGLNPMEFVNQTRRQHKLIMGIGHRVKSVS